MGGGAEGTWPTTSAFKSPSAHQENLPLPLLLDVLLWQKILQAAQGGRGSPSQRGLPRPDSPVLPALEPNAQPRELRGQTLPPAQGKDPAGPGPKLQTGVLTPETQSCASDHCEAQTGSDTGSRQNRRLCRRRQGESHSGCHLGPEDRGARSAGTLHVAPPWKFRASPRSLLCMQTG